MPLAENPVERAVALRNKKYRPDGTKNLSPSETSQIITSFIYKRLREGATKSLLKKELMRTFSLKANRADAYLCSVNSLLKRSAEEVRAETNDYLITNVQAILEDAVASGNKNAALKAAELLAKLTGALDEKPDVDVNVNLGFDYGE